MKICNFFIPFYLEEKKKIYEKVTTSAHFANTHRKYYKIPIPIFRKIVSPSINIFGTRACFRTKLSAPTYIYVQLYFLLHI